jgi:hypothetical protein
MNERDANNPKSRTAEVPNTALENRRSTYRPADGDPPLMCQVGFKRLCFVLASVLWGVVTHLDRSASLGAGHSRLLCRLR